MQDIANYKTPSPSTLENQQVADDFNEFNDFNDLFIHHTYFFHFKFAHVRPHT